MDCKKTPKTLSHRRLALHLWALWFIQSKGHLLVWHDALGLKHKDAAGVRLQVRLTELRRALHFLVVTRNARDSITVSLPQMDLFSPALGHPPKDNFYASIGRRYCTLVTKVYFLKVDISSWLRGTERKKVPCFEKSSVQISSHLSSSFAKERTVLSVLSLLSLININQAYTLSPKFLS